MQPQKERGMGGMAVWMDQKGGDALQKPTFRTILQGRWQGLPSFLLAAIDGPPWSGRSFTHAANHWREL